MSAIGYCHSLKICHRDLKPENILLTKNDEVKIADFGMAALHQSESHKLQTACGSPHYAAPELLKGKHYRGDKADVWSLGVILYAMLSAQLPFDDPNISVQTERIKKGHYDMPEFLSMEAKDLIRRMLTLKPEKRISIKDMWYHPLIRKYDHLDSLGLSGGLPADVRNGFQCAPVRSQDIDSQLLRQLRSMWHMYSDHDIRLKLVCDQ
jgi:serine/threonine-protein kinase HSL1, negative regulator of Swe1 kinase